MPQWGARQWLRLDLEQDNAGNPTPGVASTKTSPVLWTDYAFIELDQDNAFGVIDTPVYAPVRSASSGNEVSNSTTSIYDVAGPMSTLLYPQMAKFLLDMACRYTPSGEKWSYTATHFDSQVTKQFLGGKVGKFNLRSPGGNDQYVRLNYDWLFAQKVDSPTALAQPADSVFTTIAPYTHVDSDGHVMVNGTAVDEYANLDLTIENILSGRRLNKKYLSGIVYAGRNITWGGDFEYDDAAARKLAFDNATILTSCQVGFTKGANSVVFDLKSRNLYSKNTRALPLGGASTQSIEIMTMRDRTAGTSMSYTVV